MFGIFTAPGRLRRVAELLENLERQYKLQVESEDPQDRMYETLGALSGRIDSLESQLRNLKREVSSSYPGTGLGAKDWRSRRYPSVGEREPRVEPSPTPAPMPATVISRTSSAGMDDMAEYSHIGRRNPAPPPFESGGGGDFGGGGATGSWNTPAPPATAHPGGVSPAMAAAVGLVSGGFIGSVAGAMLTEEVRQSYSDSTSRDYGSDSPAPAPSPSYDSSYDSGSSSSDSSSSSSSDW